MILDNKQIVIPYRVTRDFIKSHPELLFVYSNDYLQRGALGMAWSMANEPNTFMVPVMYKYCANPVYFQDVNYDEWQPKIRCAVQCIPLDGRPIIPMLGIGKGCSRMKEFAPKLYRYIWDELDKIKWPNIKINYNP